MMKSRWSIFFIYGLMMNSVELSDTSADALKTCIDSFKKYTHSTEELLTMLSDVYEKAKVPFKVHLNEDNAEFLKGEKCDTGDMRSSCSFESLIGRFYADVTAIQIHESEGRTNAPLQGQEGQKPARDVEISLTVKSGVNDSSMIEDFCKNIITSLSNRLPVKRTTPCTTSPSLPCEDVCNTDKTTPAENQIPSTAKMTKQKEDSQVSYIVIASLASFLGGVLCTVFTFVVYRFKCHGKLKHESRDDNTGFDDIHLKTKVTAKPGGKQESGQTTYETLAGTNCAIVDNDNANADHVYLGLNAGSKYENVGENAQQAYNTVNLRHNLNNWVKTDNVYNVLKKEEAVRVYEDTMTKHLTEHTYTGLTGQEPDNRRVKYENTEAVSGSNDNRSSEAHNYFTLQDEDNRNTGNVTSDSNASVDMAGDNLSSTDHDYFTLHKTDQSNCPAAETDQTDENIESENYTLGHDYHTLEIIEKEK